MLRMKAREKEEEKNKSLRKWGRVNKERYTKSSS